MKKTLAKAFRKAHDQVVKHGGDKIAKTKHGRMLRMACKIHQFKKK